MVIVLRLVYVRYDVYNIDNIIYIVEITTDIHETYYISNTKWIAIFILVRACFNVA